MGIGSSIFAKKSDLTTNSFVKYFLEKGEISYEVHTLLDRIKQASADAYQTLMVQLHSISVRNANTKEIVHIKAHHFNTVVRLLFLQRSLSPDIEMHVNNYLDLVDPDSVTIIQNLRAKHLSKINQQAKTNNLTHHTLDHGIELKVRSIQVINQDLGMYNGHSDYDVFMRNILSFAFECHDYFQGVPAIGYATVEEQTVDSVIGWLAGEDGFPDLSLEVLSWIRYQITYVISVGTTIAFSINSPMPLSRLMVIFESACQKSNISLNHSSNELSCFNTKVTAHVVGCFDTIAYAMRSAVKRQASSEFLNTEIYLNRFYALKFGGGSGTGHVSVLKQIMVSEKMQAYYVDDSLEVNFQAFTKSLVPKFGMSIEFANNSLDCSIKSKALLIGNFIREIKEFYTNTNDLDLALLRFDMLFDLRDVGQAVEDIFLREENITAESNFSKSNIGRVCLANNILKGYFDPSTEISSPDSAISDVAKKADSIITPRAVEADWNNIVKFLQGYKKLNIDLKECVLKEIVLNLIIQAGRLYLNNPSLEVCLDSIPRSLLVNTDHLDCSTLLSDINSDQQDDTFISLAPKPIF